jgi:hypothetical protein
MGSDAPPISQPPSARRNLRELFRRELSGKSWNRSGRTINTLSSHSSHDEKRKCQNNVSFADEAVEGMDHSVRFIETCEIHTEPLSDDERNLYFYTVRIV